MSIRIHHECTSIARFLDMHCNNTQGGCSLYSSPKTQIGCKNSLAWEIVSEWLIERWGYNPSLYMDLRFGALTLVVDSGLASRGSRLVLEHFIWYKCTHKDSSIDFLSSYRSVYMSFSIHEHNKSS